MSAFAAKSFVRIKKTRVRERLVVTAHGKLSSREGSFPPASREERGNACFGESLAVRCSVLCVSGERGKVECLTGKKMPNKKAIHQKVKQLLSAISGGEIEKKEGRMPNEKRGGGDTILSARGASPTRHVINWGREGKTML